MAAMIGDFVVETASAPGTGTINLAGAATGAFVSFAARFSTGAQVFYTISDESAQRESGVGTFTTGAPNTLSRNTVLSNTSGTTAKLNFTGTVYVYTFIPAGHAVYADASNNVALPNNLSVVGTLAAGSTSITGTLAVSGLVTSPNQIGYQVKDTGGTARTLITIDALNNVNLSNGGAALWRVLSQSGSTMFTLDNSGNTFIGSGQSSNPVGTQLAGTYVSAGGQVNSYQATAGATYTIGSSSGSQVVFYNGNSQVVGTITYSGLTTTYGTTSDATLKDLDHTMTAVESGPIIDGLAPLWFRWKSAPNAPAEPGFFAQELAQVFPWAARPGAGSPGDPDYMPAQSDAIRLIPVLVAEVQALRARVAALESR